MTTSPLDQFKPIPWDSYTAIPAPKSNTKTQSAMTAKLFGMLCFLALACGGLWAANVIWGQ